MVRNMSSPSGRFLLDGLPSFPPQYVVEDLAPYENLDSDCLDVLCQALRNVLATETVLST